jgi:hypothetical protein
VPPGTSYGVLFDVSQWSDFVNAGNIRHDKGITYAEGVYRDRFYG